MDADGVARVVITRPAAVIAASALRNLIACTALLPVRFADDATRLLHLKRAA